MCRVIFARIVMAERTEYFPQEKNLKKAGIMNWIVRTWIHNDCLLGGRSGDKLTYSSLHAIFIFMTFGGENSNMSKKWKE